MEIELKIQVSTTTQKKEKKGKVINACIHTHAVIHNNKKKY